MRTIAGNHNKISLSQISRWSTTTDIKSYYLIYTNRQSMEFLQENMYTNPKNLFQNKVNREVDENTLRMDNKTITTNLIQQIITLKDDSGQEYIQKYGIDSILGNIQKHQIEIVQLFQKYLKDGFNILQFVRFFLNIIPHNHIENLYLTIGLIDLFREITLQTHKDKIILKDITDYMCDKILKNDKSFNKIQAKFLPIGKFIRPTLEKKKFLQTRPTIYGETDQKIHKLCQKCIKTDCSKHSRAIIKSQFSFDLKKVFILDSLTESVSVYDDNCNLTQKISPVLSKLKKQVIILDFAFSQRQFRIGAVLKDFSIKFWDHFINFEYQKSISTTSICQNLQTSIYFLQYFNKWLTADKTGSLHLWNLLEEKPDRNFKCKYHSNINDIAQIPALNLLAVVQEIKRNSKLLTQAQQNQRDNGISQATVVLYNFYNGHIITQIDLQDQRIPHTIVYSQAYQVLFMSGLQKKVKIYDVHPRYMDASLKGELVGHQNLITCFTLIKKTPMLVSADDKGKVKLWDFRCFTCLQTIDFSDKTVITNLLDMIQIGKLGVFGSRVNYIEFEDRNQIIKKQNDQEVLKIQAVDFDPHLMEMFIYTNKTLRVIDLYKGQVKHIFSFKHAPSDQQFTHFRYFSCIKKFILGSSRGEISIFNPQTGQLQSTLKECHQGSINFIEYDELNKIFISVGYDSKILIHRSSDGSMLRQLKNNFNGKEINCMQVSVYHNILLMGSNNSPSVYLWNYEYGKIIGQIRLQNEYPIAIHVINGFGILLIATSAQKIHMFKAYISNIDLQMEYIDSISVQRIIVNVYSDLKLKGKGKNTQCQSSKVVVSCQSGQLYQFDIQSFMKEQSFKMHCKQKSNYNPYRQCKQNFISQLQKIKHKVLVLSKQMNKLSQVPQIFREKTQIVTDLTSINISKLLRLEQSLNLVVGNDRRIKIWNQASQLVCDYNINYCLPYKWDLKPLSMAITTEKIYYGIKVLQTIFKKYQNDISIGESKNLQIKELFQFIEKINNDKKSIQKVKMITQPNEMSYDHKKFKQNQVTLLQNEYSRKDLNYELVKRFNFTEIAGPTLKELDNIKKIQILQRQWKVKENKQEKQKEQLLKNIQSKAKKNQEKEQIQILFVKQKKAHIKEPKVQYQRVTGLLKKLNSMENKSSASSDQKKTITFLYKNLYNRFGMKGDIEGNSSILQKKVGQVCHSQSRFKKSFEGYYIQKYNKQLKEKQKIQKEANFGFRDILTEMNGRVISIKKYRYRPQIREK